MAKEKRPITKTAIFKDSIFFLVIAPVTPFIPEFINAIDRTFSTLFIVLAIYLLFALSFIWSIFGIWGKREDFENSWVPFVLNVVILGISALIYIFASPNNTFILDFFKDPKGLFN